MKLIFYGTDGEAGKARRSELLAGKVECRLLHAMACKEPEPCETIEFMPDVTASERQRIANLFSLPDVAGGEVSKPNSDSNPHELKVGLGPRGKIYIRRGREIHSGPFNTQADAEEALAKELSS